MEYPKPTIQIDGQSFELLSDNEFRHRMNMPQVPKPTLRYKMLESGELDYTVIGETRYVIFNEKAKNFSLAKRRPRK